MWRARRCGVHGAYHDLSLIVIAQCDALSRACLGLLVVLSGSQVIRPKMMSPASRSPNIHPPDVCNRGCRRVSHRVAARHHIALQTWPWVRRTCSFSSCSDNVSKTLKQNGHVVAPLCACDAQRLPASQNRSTSLEKFSKHKYPVTTVPHTEQLTRLHHSAPIHRGLATDD